MALSLSACAPTANDATPAAQPTESKSGTEATVAATSPPGDQVTIERVFDGDSFLAVTDGGEAEIRMLGINAPEGDECHGSAARETLERFLASGTITLVADGEDRDQYGRLLRYVYVDGLNVNLALLAGGDAVALQGDHSLDTRFSSVGDIAANDTLGLWAPDACGSEVLPDIQILDYVYNPPGRDEENMNSEWVAVVNRDAAPINLGGWVLRDESSRHRFSFPANFILVPGADVLVHSGCDEDTQANLYWCAAGPVWSNGGDTIILQLGDGTVVARERFAGDF